MKRILTAISLIALSAAPAALAGDGNHAEAPVPYDIAVEYSADFMEKLEDDYGVREGDYLAGEVMEDIARAMTKRGVAFGSIKVTILDAKPNRPTFEQLSAEPGLSFQSFGIGGMKLAATAFDEDGSVLGKLEYSWFENDIRDAQGRATWWDANRASRRFATKFAKQLAG